MSGVRSEPAEVWLNDGRPARFVWRGRLYTVIAMLERPAVDAAAAADAAEVQAGRRPRPRWRCWRVTASPGKNVPADAYRLCHDAEADRWRLSRDPG